MRTLLKFLLMVFIFLTLIAVYAERAEAHHFAAPSAVTRSEEVVYLDDTHYNAMYEGIRRWNQVDVHYHSRGVHFRPARSGERPTLIITDWRACGDSWAGIYVPGYKYTNGVPRIILNTCQMQHYSYAQRLTTVTHELGHSIDLGHPPHTTWFLHRAIMYDSIVGNRGTIGPHDMKDYRNRWVR